MRKLLFGACTAFAVMGMTAGAFGSSDATKTSIDDGNYTLMEMILTTGAENPADLVKFDSESPITNGLEISFTIHPTDDDGQTKTFAATDKAGANEYDREFALHRPDITGGDKALALNPVRPASGKLAMDWSTPDASVLAINETGSTVTWDTIALTEYGLVDTIVAGINTWDSLATTSIVSSDQNVAVEVGIGFVKISAAVWVDPSTEMGLTAMHKKRIGDALVDGTVEPMTLAVLNLGKNLADDGGGINTPSIVS